MELVLVEYIFMYITFKKDKKYQVCAIHCFICVPTKQNTILRTKKKTMELQNNNLKAFLTNHELFSMHPLKNTGITSELIIQQK